MRPLLLVLVLLVPMLAGCGTPVVQFAGIVHAYQYQETTLLEMQLHRAQGSEPASLETAEAGFKAIDRLENATLNVTINQGSRRVDVREWTFDEDNDTITALVPVTGFDRFHLEATFVLTNGTRVSTEGGMSWTEVFSRPYQGTMNVEDRGDTSFVTLSVYQVVQGATVFEYYGGLGESTMTPLNITRVDAWHLRVTGENGTVVEETAPASVTGTTLTATLPYGGVAEADARFTLSLKEGKRITQRDVDGDAWPLSVVTQRERSQEN